MTSVLPARPPADAYRPDHRSSLLRGRSLLPLSAADPRRIGPVELICRLPPGGQGCDVFVGELPPGSGRLVVVKRLPCELGRAAHRLFAREVAVASLVRGRHLPAVLHVDLSAPDPCYVQELVPGTPLPELLRSAGGCFDRDRAHAVAVDALRALAELHEQGVVHGDVKPGNLIVASSRTWLIDLGLGRLVSGDDEDTGLLAQRGTKHYASPEHFRADGLVGPAADLFGWGLVVLRVHAGRHPVDPELRMGDEEYYRVLTAGGLDLRPLADPLRAAVGRALSVDPAARGSAIELLRLLDQGTSPVRPVGPLPAAFLAV